MANPPEVVDKPADAQLRLPPGFAIDVFADGTGFKTLRNLIEAPNGDLFAADFSANTITLLRDTNNDGTVDERKVAASGLHGPYGMAISNGFFYVGNTASVVRWKFAPGDTTLSGTPEKIATLPSGGGHVTRSLAFSEDGSKLYVTIGSASNVDVEQGRALIRVMSPDGTGGRVFASGLRNPVGLAIRPGTDEVWAGVHERDMLGDNLVPDYVTRVQDGGFYGWPYAYIGPNEDPRRKGEQPDLVKKAIVPDVLLQSHSAPMGLAFYTGTQFPAEYAPMRSWRSTARGIARTAPATKWSASSCATASPLANMKTSSSAGRSVRTSRKCGGVPSPSSCTQGWLDAHHRRCAQRHLAGHI